MKKRILSFLLALLMVVSIFHMPTHAEYTGYESETPTEPEKHPDLGKMVKFNSSWPWAYKSPTNFNDGTQLNAAKFPKVMRVVEVHEVGTSVIYKLETGDGSSWPEAYDGYFYIDSTKVTAAVKCSNCGEYECGIDHSATEPTVPENPCDCGCETCTGAEGCVCGCENCDFCEKKEEPTAPSISATVNGQTVTVSGEALPEGATLTVTDAVPNLDGGFAYDIIIHDANGNEWQPIDGQEVRLSIPVSGVADGEYIELIHLLENETAIQKAISEGNVWTEEWVADIFPAAATAYLALTGEENTFAFEVFKLEPKDGMVKVPVTTFSVYFWTGSSFTSTVAGVSDDIIFHDTLTSDRSTETFYVTPGQAIRCNRGGITVFEREWRFGGISLTYDKNLTGADGARIYFTVPSNATIGTNFWIECRVDKAMIGDNWSSWHRVNFVVVNNWTVNFYRNYDSSDNTVYSSDTGVLSGGVGYVEPVVFPSAPTRTGYKFMGWAETRDGTTVNTSTWRPNQNNDSLFAIWKAQYKYSLTFNANAPTGTTVTSMPSNYSSSAWEDASSKSIPVSNPSCSCYIFKGWSESASAKTGTMYSSYTLTGTSAGTTSKTLYAVWEPITYSVNFNANGGTGSMASQTMTYNESATLNENLFTPKPGYVFAGWSTSATGSVNYSDKQSVSNLASTQDAVVNLYAVWVNTMAFEDVRVGLNESYWFTNFMYTVTADGVASSSYHAFPAEPAKQAIRHTRASKDANGNWVISADDILPGTASAYIDPSIVYSNLFRYSVVASDTTRGVADPTGANVKAFLKFTDADYTAMIKVWLQSMADRTADTPNADGTYNIENRGATYKTDVNWNEEVDNWEEYEVIPYVIKMENYNCWRIDMIIAPMRYLTLSYDLNINTAIGYSLTGGSSIPNTQYERDTTQNVLVSPHAYNSNIEVSKTVNGVKYTAEFLYWEDEQGIKYGTGYNSTVLMDGHKNLKAIWRYPDQTMGSLRVEKDVTVPVNTGLTPDTSKAFTITVELGTSGSYPYTKYSSTGIVTETSNFTGTTKSFTLKADEYVIITGINQGITYKVSETAPTGYTNKSGTITGTIQAGNTKSATIVNENSSYTESFDFNGGSNTNTSVTVVYGSTNYFDVSWLKPTRTGHKFLGWFTAKEGGTQVYTDEGICIDGAYWSSKKWIGTADLPLYAQWEEEKYTVTFVDDDGTTILSEAEYDYGTPAASIVKPADPSKAATAEYTYEFTGWTPALSAVTGNATYTATYKATKRSYTITWLNDDDSVIDTTTVAYGEVPTHADPSKAATAEYTYTFAGWSPEVVAVTGEASYKATFTPVKRSYTITWLNDDDSVIDTTTVAYGEVPTHADPSKAATAEYTYTFAGWSPEVAAVTGEATYKATYTAKKNKYTIIWKNEDGTVLEKDTGVEYGTMPSYDGETPTKEPYNQFTYTFRAWSPEIVAVTGDAVYIASFDPHENFYTVTWVNHDGEVLETDENVAWDTMPEYNGDTPEKTGNAEHSYNFAGWSPTVSKVNGHATYTATFAESVNTYTVTWKNEDGTVLETDEDMVYGAMPSYNGETPEKAATAQYTYTFDGWDKEVVAVTGDVTYTAKFSATVNKYTVTFVDEDGTTILKEATEYDYGTAAEHIVKPADPTKDSTDEFTYTFAGWTPEIADVTSNVTYKATYTETKKQYTMTGVIEHGTVTGPMTVNYGEHAELTFTADTGYEMTTWRKSTETEDRTFASPQTGPWRYGIQQLKTDVTVTVYTRPIAYTITYVLRGGALTEGTTNPETYTIETETFTLNNPTRAGYKFKGWATSESATTGEGTYAVETGTTGDKIFYAIWERSLVDLTITADCDDQEQSLIFTVSGTRSDGVAFAPIDVVLCRENNFQVTIKDMPVGEYTVTEKDGWSWRENSIDSKTADLRTTSQTVSFDFGVVDDLHWLSGYSYKRKKGGS